MKIETLETANELLKEINTLERIIRNCQNQKCEWIEFTFGNGSNKETVCNDPKIINKVIDLLIIENEIKLDALRNKFNSL